MEGVGKGIVVTFLLLSGCAHQSTRDRIVLDNMPSTLIILRGPAAAEELCETTRNLWGCAHLEYLKDKCTIALNDERGPNTDIHELIHCNGGDEEEARRLAGYP